jgi:adenylate kinase
MTPLSLSLQTQSPLAPVLAGAWTVLGAPGSGRRSTLRTLSRELDLPILPARDLLRSAALDLKARRLRGYIEAGAPVPSPMALGVLLPFMELEAFRHGFVLDGYPETQEQALALDLWLAAQGRPPVEALYLDVPFDTLLRRLSGRRYCRICTEKTYNVFSAPSKRGDKCETCGEALYQRHRDRPEEVSSALVKARHLNRELALYYEAKGCLRRQEDAPVRLVA